MRPDGEREAWLHVVRPSELDTHMAAVGQAEANAQLVKELLAQARGKKGDRLLVHGCGTCQMFDYIDPAALGRFRLTFADLSEEMLSAARTRLRRISGLDYEIVVDDIEQSRLQGPFNIIILAMVLLHVDWRQSIARMLALDPRWLIVVEQEQAPDTPVVSSTRPVPASIRKFSEVAHPQLIRREDLIGVVRKEGYAVVAHHAMAVPDDKTMVGVLFAR